MKTKQRVLKTLKLILTRIYNHDEHSRNYETSPGNAEENVSGGGMVKVVLNGKFEMKKVTIDTSLVVADETDILEDLITAAYNDAKAKVDAKMQNSVSDMTGGLNLGGLKLPF